MSGPWTGSRSTGNSKASACCRTSCARVTGSLPWQTRAENAASDNKPDESGRISRDYDLVYVEPDGHSRKQVIGQLHVEASLDPLHAQLREMAWSILVTELLRSTLLAAPLILGMRHLVTRRLSHIATYAAALSIDNLGSALVMPDAGRSGDDDIDRLAKSIDEMRTTLHREIERRLSLESESRALLAQKQAAELADATKSEFLANMSPRYARR